MQRLFQNLGWILLLNLLTKPLWILTENAVQNEVGHADFGRFAAVYAWAMILASVADAGLNQYLTKTIAPNPEKYDQLFWTFLGTKGFLLILYVIICTVTGLLWGFSGNDLQLLIICAGIHAGIGGLFAVRAVFQGFQAFHWDGWSSVTDKILLMLFLLLGLLSWKLTVSHYAWATLAITWGTVIGLSAVIYKRYGTGAFRFQWLSAGKLLRNSLPLALITLLFTVNEHLNKILVQALAGDESAGLFAGAYRWFGAFSMYLWTVLPVFYAQFAKYQHEPPARQQQLFNTALTVVALPILYVTAVIQFHGEQLFFLFHKSTARELASMSEILKVLSIALLINAYFNVFSTYLTATGKEKYVNYLLILAILIGNGFNIVFIPFLGGVAAAWGLVMAFGLLSIGYLVYFQRKTSLRIPITLFAKVLTLTAVFGITFWGIEQILITWVWWIKSGLAGLVLVVLVFLFKLVPTTLKFKSE